MNQLSIGIILLSFISFFFSVTICCKCCTYDKFGNNNNNNNKPYHTLDSVLLQS